MRSLLLFKAGNFGSKAFWGTQMELPDPSRAWSCAIPVPLSGGNMNNNLVLSVHIALPEQGIVFLRFNFRGVGNSEGVHAQGELEPEDAEAALKVLQDRADVDENPLGMAGYPFWSGVILSSLSRYASAKAFVLF